MPTIRLTLFWAKSVTSDPAGAMVHYTRKKLRKLGFGLDVYPRPTEMLRLAHTLDYDEQFPDDDATYLEPALKLRDLAHHAYPTGQGRLPVIFVPFTVYATSDGGRSMRQGKWGNASWLPYTILNTKYAVPAGIALLHEIGHCARLEHDYTARPPNFMYAHGTTDLLENVAIKPEQLRKIKEAYFVSAV
jgi:hypothetical protein